MAKLGPGSRSVHGELLGHPQTSGRFGDPGVAARSSSTVKHAVWPSGISWVPPTNTAGAGSRRASLRSSSPSTGRPRPRSLRRPPDQVDVVPKTKLWVFLEVDRNGVLSRAHPPARRPVARRKPGRHTSWIARTNRLSTLPRPPQLISQRSQLELCGLAVERGKLEHQVGHDAEDLIIFELDRIEHPCADRG